MFNPKDLFKTEEDVIVFLQKPCSLNDLFCTLIEFEKHELYCYSILARKEIEKRTIMYYKSLICT